MKRLLSIAVVALLGGCVSDGNSVGAAHGQATRGHGVPVAANSAASGADVARWTPKAGLVATVIVMEPEKFYKLSDQVRPDLRNRPVAAGECG